MLCRGLCARLPEFANAPHRRQPAQARAAGDIETKCRRRDEAPAARRWRLGIAALMSRYCCAGSAVSSRWRLGVVALVYRHRRAGASALTKLSRWPVGIVALVHVVALARRKRATVLAFFFLFFYRLDTLACK
jgi:hypothetical protein